MVALCSPLSFRLGREEKGVKSRGVGGCTTGALRYHPCFCYVGKIMRNVDKKNLEKHYEIDASNKKSLVKIITGLIKVSCFLKESKF